MGIQARDHARDGVVDEFFLIDGFDIVGFDHAEHLGQLLEFFERQGRHIRSRHGLQRERGERTRECAHGQPACDFEFLTHVNPALTTCVHALIRLADSLLPVACQAGLVGA